jgi:hypothetical protein
MKETKNAPVLLTPEELKMVAGGTKEGKLENKGGKLKKGKSADLKKGGRRDYN